MIYLKFLLFYSFVLPLCGVTIISAQEHIPPNGKEENHHFKRHSISYFDGVTFIPKVHDESLSQTSVNFTGTMGFNYQYKINHRIALKWANDIEFGNYFISVDDKLLARENVFITALLFSYEPLHGLEIAFGPGVELEENKNFFVLRGAFEYQMLIANDWYIGPEVIADYKEDYYTFSIGVILAKHF